jgi:hypothetical protein
MQAILAMAAGALAQPLDNIDNLDTSDAALREAFDAAADEMRVLALLSPT